MQSILSKHTIEESGFFILLPDYAKQDIINFSEKGRDALIY